MRLLTLFLFLLIPALSPAQKIRFVARKCVIPKEDQKQIQIMAEHEFAFFREVFGNTKSPAIRITIYGDFDEFMKTQRSYPRYSRSSSGYFSPARREIAVYKQAGYLQTCYHEMSHAIYHMHCNSIPTWINEGLATYFEYASVDSLGKVHRNGSPYQKRRMKSVVAGRHFSVSRLVDLSHKKFHKYREGKHYSESWGIVYFLITKHPEDFYDLMRGLGNSKKSSDVLDGIYSGGIPKLNSDLVRYYSQ